MPPTKNQRIELVNGGRKVDGVFQANPAKTDPVITSNDLSTQPEFNITEPKPETKSTGMLGAIEESTDTFTSNLEADRKSKENEYSKSRTDVQDFIKTLRGETGLTNEAYDKGGVNEVETELNDINQQIRQEQRSLDNRLRILDENKGGGLASGVEAEKSNARRESLKTQADLYIIQQGVQGRYDSAKTIADRAVDAYMEAQDLKLKALEFNYQDNKDLFTKAEQREFETAQGDRERRLKREEQNLTDIYELALTAQKDGAPTSVVESMLKSKTKEEALGLGGSYIGAQDRILKSLQAENLRSEISKRDKEASDTTIKRTDGEWKALGFGERMLDAETVIDELGEKFSTIGGAAKSTIPYTQSKQDKKRFEQAERNFINAVLRNESGASIAPEEFDNARKQYIPQVNDGPEVLIQKKQNRAMVTKNFLLEGKADTSLQDRLLEDPLGLNLNVNTTNPLGL